MNCYWSTAYIEQNGDKATGSQQDMDFQSFPTLLWSPQGEWRLGEGGEEQDCIQY